jgi:hypothetical protein
VGPMMLFARRIQAPMLEVEEGDHGHEGVQV